MAHRISQDTFDAAVQENIDEFEMSPDDAVAEAVQQFQAQGVNLDAIVKSYRLPSHSNASGAKHQVVEAVENLQQCLQTDNSSTSEASSMSGDQRHSLVKACDVLRDICKVSVAERCLATKSGAYALLLDILNLAIKESNRQILISALDALSELVNGNPDVLDDVGANMLMTFLKESESSEEMQVPTALVLRIIKNCCVMHEENRQRYVAKGLIEQSAKLLTSPDTRHNREIIIQICSVYGVLTLDDDLRVPFGKAHEHAKLIVTEADAMTIMLDLAKEYLSDVDVLLEVYTTIGRLAVRDEFCRQVLDLGGVKNLLESLQNNISSQSLVRTLLGVLKTLCGSDPVKVEFIRHEGGAIVLDCINKHARDAGVCAIGCAVIAAVVLRYPAHCTTVMDGGAAECIVRCLQIHSDSANVQKQASAAIRNIVSRCPEYCSPFLDLGVEAMLRKALIMHSATWIEDEVKPALRDLGCSIELKELWTGTGRDLIHD